MSFSPRDPKGYYKTLGVSPDADANAIKQAFRARAKDVHPDASDAPDAAAQFHALQEAYEVLSDSLRRKGYDAKATHKTSEPKAKPKQDPPPRSEPPKQPRKERPDPTPKAKPEPEPRPKPKAKSKAKAKPTDGVKPHLCACGKVSAQPRHVEFDMVRGLGNRIQRRTVGNIYCRGCADRAGLKASLISWLAGWWAWPMGPKATIQTIWSNMRGGRMPQSKNAELLLHQAKAFRDRGDKIIAKAIARQGLVFASTGPTRAALDSVLAGLKDVPDRPLKNPWRTAGWAPMLHMAPAALVIVLLSMTLSVSAPEPVSQAFNAVRSVLQGTSQEVSAPIRLHQGYTTVRRVALRTGPAESYAPLVMLAPGVVVTPSEVSEDQMWARVRTTAGEVGFLRTQDLRPVSAP